VLPGPAEIRWIFITNIKEKLYKNCVIFCGKGKNQYKKSAEIFFTNLSAPKLMNKVDF
jgi:hypothetical protein